MSKALVYSIYMYTVERSSQQKQMDLVNSLAAFLAEAVIPLQPQKAKISRLPHRIFGSSMFGALKKGVRAGACAPPASRNLHTTQGLTIGHAQAGSIDGA